MTSHSPPPRPLPPPPGPSAPPPGPLPDRDALMLAYARETCLWIRFIGIIVAVSVVAEIVLGIIVANQVERNANTGSSTCQSQGGTLPC